MTNRSVANGDTGIRQNAGLSKTKLLKTQARGILFVGHGTRDPLGTEQFFELTSRLRECFIGLPVESALLEFQEPSIPQAWESLVRAGVEHIHVAPLLLFAAGHAKQDIPNLLSKCQQNSPHISYDQSRPLSRHPSLVELVVERISATLAPYQTPLARTALVMVGRGNRDPCAQADMRVLSEVVGQRLSISTTVTAFYAMAKPRLSDVLDRIAAGQFDFVVVHPHLLFEGRLHQAIAAQITEADRRDRSTRVILSGYLGPDGRVAQGIATRIRQLDCARKE